jgi:hypothetical protein
MIYRNYFAEVCLRSPGGVDRSVIRTAFGNEAQYQKIVGTDFPVPPVKPKLVVTSLQQAEAIANEKAPRISWRTLDLAPVTPVALPQPPAVSLTSSITEDDLEKYLKPLITNGWRLGGIRPMRRFKESRDALRNVPCLHRLYCFNDYASARHFFHTVVAAIPEKPPNSLVRSRVSYAGLVQPPSLGRRRSADIT